MTSPTVIVPGPDGNMWFTEKREGHVAEIDPGFTDIPNSPRRRPPVAPWDRYRVHGNLWFTESLTSKVGLVGAGRRRGRHPPAVTGIPQPAEALTCQAATWSAWAGEQPGFGFGMGSVAARRQPDRWCDGPGPDAAGR